MMVAGAVTLVLFTAVAKADVMTPPMAEAQSEYRTYLSIIDSEIRAEWLEWFTDINGPWFPQITHSHPTAETRPPTPTYGPGVTQWTSLVAAYFLPEHIDAALSVMNCESGGDPLAAHPHSTASGLFQFLKAWWSGQWALPAFDPFDPEANIAAAATVTGGGVDWGHWFASRHCHGL